MKDKLQERKEKKAKTPKFVRHAAHRKPKLANNWRRPKGLQNKLRLNKKSRGTNVSTGFRTDKVVRGLTQSGKKECVVYTKKELLNAEPEVHALTIGAVGNKRKLELLEEAKKQGFEVTNHNVDETIAQIKDSVKNRGQKTAERVKKRDALLKQAQQAPEKKASAAAKKTAQTKEEQKKEQDKVLAKGVEQ